MKSGKIIMDLEDALRADYEEALEDSKRLDWLLENNKIAFDAVSRKDIDSVIELSEYLDNLKPTSPESN